MFKNGKIGITSSIFVRLGPNLAHFEPWDARNSLKDKPPGLYQCIC